MRVRRRTASSPPPAHQPKNLPRWAPTAVVIGVLAAQGALAFHYVRDAWFGVDALHYFAVRGTLPGENAGLLEPYAGHWISGLLVVYRGLFELVGLRDHLPYAGVAIGAHLAIVLLSYLILVRCRVGRWPAAACALLLATFGAGSEAFLFDSPLALTGATALGLLAIWMLVRGSFARPAVIRAAIALVVAVTFSVTGVVMAVVVAGFVARVKGWRTALLVASPSAAAFGLWFMVYGRHTDRVQASGEQLLNIPSLAISLLVAPLDNLLALPGAGAVLTIGVLVALLLTGHGDPGSLRRELAWAGVLGACLQAALSALASAHLPPESVLVGRYQYVVLVLMLPAVALVLGQVSASAARRSGKDVLVAAVVAVLLAGVLVNGVRGQWKTHQFVTAESELFRSMFTGTFAATAAGELVLTRDLSGHFLRADDMATIARSGAVGELPPLYPTPQQRLEAEGAFFVGVRNESMGLPEPADMTSDSFDRKRLRRTGCTALAAQTFAPVVTLTSFEGAEISVRSAAGTVSTRLVRDGLASQSRSWPLDPSRTSYIGTTAELATLELTFDAGGEFIICRT